MRVVACSEKLHNWVYYLQNKATYNNFVFAIEQIRNKNGSFRTIQCFQYDLFALTYLFRIFFYYYRYINCALNDFVI